MQPKHTTRTCPNCGGPIGPKATICRSCSNRRKGQKVRDSLPALNPSGICQCGCGRQTGIAERTYAHQGVALGHHYRFLPGHHKRKFPPVSYDVDPETGCWNWTGPKSGKGYGGAYANGRKEPAHRMMYRIHKGEIPEGLQLDHLCRNRACVNPEHLEPVTAATNIQRGSGTKLTPDQVDDIRASRPAVTIRELAERHGVSQTTVAAIARGEKWKDRL